MTRLDKLETSFQTLPKFVRNHSERVGCLLRYFVNELSAPVMKGTLSELIYVPSPEEAQLLGRYHDIGKVSVSNEIWESPSALSDMEKRIIRVHTIVGAYLVKPDLSSYDQEYAGSDLTELLLQCCLFHHERWDGSGYPFGLKGEKIPVIARILSIVDAYEAMTANRPYHKKIPKQTALEEIQNCAGTQFDPTWARLFWTEMAKHELNSVTSDSDNVTG